MSGYARCSPVMDDLHDQLVCVLTCDKPCFLFGDTNFDVLLFDKTGMTPYLQMQDELPMS